MMQQLYNDIPCSHCEDIITELSYSHLGILSGPAIRRALRIETEAIRQGTAKPMDIIASDYRKLHEWNEPSVLGYDLSNVYFAEFAQTRGGRDRRQIERAAPSRRPTCRDLRGQWNGDELVFGVEAGQGIGLLMRFIHALDTLSERLTPAQRDAMRARTGGLFDGFAAVFVLIQNSTDVYRRNGHVDEGDAARAVAECGVLKSGNVTGARATSGRAGTIIGTLKAGGM